MKDIGLLKELLKKYDLVLPVQPGEQRKIYRSKRKTLAVIIDGNKKSFFITRSAVRFYYILRSMGVNATLASGMRAAVFASVLSLLLVAGASVLLLQNYIYNQALIAVNDTGKNGIITASFDLKIKREGSERFSFSSGDYISEGDDISTGDNPALFQFSNRAVVKVMKKTSIFITDLDPEYKINLKYGGIITRIPAIQNGLKYTIVTPDSSVSVRGTEFGVVYEDGRTEVFVSSGKVLVKHISTGTEYEVPEGNSTIVNQEKNIVPLSEKELFIMKGFSSLNYIDSISTKSPDEIRSVHDSLKASDELKADALTQTKKMTLEELKKKYGKLDEVMLYSGKKYTGVIVSRGGVYKILTPGGTVSVPLKEVKGSKIIQ